MTKIVFLDKSSLRDTVDFYRPNFVHTWEQYGITQADEVIPRLQGANIAIINKSAITDAVLTACPDLEMVLVAATGYNIVDTEACQKHGVMVINVEGYSVHTVTEHAIGMMISLRRSFPGYRDAVQAGEWQKSKQFCYLGYPIRDLAHDTLGIIGSGNLGQAVAKIARTIGMKVIFSERKNAPTIRNGYVAFDDMLAQSDVITLHCPMTPETHNMIAMPEFKKMKKQPIIINTGRGGLINEGDTVTALNKGLIAGFGTDVLTVEPPKDGNPLLDIAHYPNVMITPHTAGSSNQAHDLLWSIVIKNLENYHNGTPTSVVVNPHV